MTRRTTQPKREELYFPPNLVRGMSVPEVRTSAGWPTVFALRRAGVCLPQDVGHIMVLIGRTFIAPNRAAT